MNRDQIWALKRDIQRRLEVVGVDDRPRGNDVRILGATDDFEITEVSLLRRTLDLLDEL